MIYAVGSVFHDCCWRGGGGLLLVWAACMLLTVVMGSCLHYAVGAVATGGDAGTRPLCMLLTVPILLLATLLDRLQPASRAIQ